MASRRRVEQRRQSHCAAKGHGVYVLQFPFNAATGEAWYSINRERALFVAGGANPDLYFARFEHDELLDHFQEKLKGKRLWTEAKEITHIPEEASGLKGGHDISIFDKAMAAAVAGRVEYLRKYLQTHSVRCLSIQLATTDSLGCAQLI